MSVLNVKAVVAAFNQEKALVGAFSVITNLRMELFEALIIITRQLGVRTWRWEECIQTAPAEYCSSCATIALLAGSSEWKYAGH